MIVKVDLKKASSFGYASREPDIGVRRGAISARVIVLCGARIYVRCLVEALVCELFYEACLIHPLHITQPHFGGYAVSRYIPY
jgi:hypothetical protein